jgi:hypothetical protein
LLFILRAITGCETPRQIPGTECPEERRRLYDITYLSLAKFKGIVHFRMSWLLNDRRTIVECTIGGYFVVPASFYFSSKYYIYLKKMFETLTESLP